MTEKRKSFWTRFANRISALFKRKAVVLPPDPFGDPPVEIDPNPNGDRDLYMGVNTR